MTQTETRYCHNETVASLMSIKSNQHIFYSEKFFTSTYVFRAVKCKPKIRIHECQGLQNSEKHGWAGNTDNFIAQDHF